MIKVSLRGLAGRKLRAVLTGVAIVLGLLAGAQILGSRLGSVDVILIVALAFLIVGTLDDRFALGIAPRLAVEVAAASALFFTGFGWSLFGDDAYASIHRWYLVAKSELCANHLPRMQMSVNCLNMVRATQLLSRQCMKAIQNSLRVESRASV